jgi:hypothetical protein
MSSTLISGGMKGADLFWAKYANIAEINIIVWSFPSHPTAPFHPKGTIIKKIKESEFIEAVPKLKEASLKLQIELPIFCKYKYKVLARYYFIVKDVQAMYVIGKLKKLPSVEGNIGVEGHNCWPCQLFANKFIDTNGNIPLYVYSERKWFNCNVDNGVFSWNECLDVPTPNTYTVFAGLGSREALADPIKALFSKISHN